ncbi:MAG: UDP-N-acetylmuramoylalanine-D-glutamate ligase [uncultured bacterium (gcode 4)]|uniref:UDP-N-acetylmuramoylalanine-D-glutamate ligase n=1 Tax=uncultured bacterium (gcode 4) TaxID=1234023 RepID=K2G9R1_9BACT|nr:MAG: UDP-N-acetylmuramoylalanine-D-glutamate ligase [uncultured bacterium (gcode 4)]
MVLIYGKGKVWNSLKEFCDYMKIDSEIKDDSDDIKDFWIYEKIIASPWIPPTNKIYKTWKVTWDLDFCYPYLPEWFRIISITWTDWKSTTAWIIYNILKQELEWKENLKERKEEISETGNCLIVWKKWVFLSGNFDEPFSKTVLEINKKWLRAWFIVVEISSFMAFNIEQFSSDYSIFTNFETDHLNWHKDMDEYFESKLKIFRNTSRKSIVNLQVLNKAKELWLNFNLDNVRFFWSDNELKDRVEDSDIIVSWRKKINVKETNFRGPYNALNILSSVLVGNEMWICFKRMKNYLKNIYWLAHRIEFYKEINWIRFIDDSKSTSAQSLKAALETFDDWKIILIAGWSDKWDKFDHLWEIIKNKVKHAELIWQTKEVIWKVFADHKISFHYSESMDEAVSEAYKKSSKWDIVLLSPGCASFWLFKDYLDRADKFKEAINNIK